MISSRRFSAFLNVQPGEGRPVALLTLLNFFFGVAFVLTQATAFALFLSEFGSQGLPFVYMAIAAGASLAAFLYLKLGERLSLARLVVVNLVSLSVLSVVFRLGLLLPQARPFVFILPVWFQILANFGGLAVWSLAGRLLDVRQSKRLFGLIGSGYWLALAVGGFVVSPILAILGTPNLLVLASISLIFAVVCQFAILRENCGPLDSPPPQSQAAERRSTTSSLLRSRYVLLFLGLVIVWWVAFFFLDNIFYDRAAIQFPDPNLLASSLGNLFAASGVLGLIITTFFTGPVLNRYGLRIGLFILPVILTVSVGGLAASGVFGLAASALFVLVALAKITSISFGFTLDLTARTLLYQPLPAERRASIQTLADGIVQPLAIGLAGALLLVFNTILGFDAIQLSFLYLIIAAIWLAVATALRTEYPVALIRALAKRRLGVAADIVVDQTYVDVLHRSLGSPYPAAVIYALNLLEQLDPASLTPVLPGLLDHGSPEVRRVALERVERLGLANILPVVRQRITLETVPEIRAAAIQALAALGGVESIDQVLPYLDGPDQELRRGAMVGLLRSAGIEGVLSAGQTLLRIADSPLPAERVLAARVLGESGIQHYYQPLLKLLEDGDLTVQNEALYAAGQIRHPKLWPAVVQALSLSRTRAAAAAALTVGGESALPEIRAALGRAGANASLRLRLAQVCSRIRGMDGIVLLATMIDDPDPAVRSEVICALSRCGYQAHSGESERVRLQLQKEFEQAGWLLACRLDVCHDEETGLLQEALADELASSRDRVMLLLSLIYPPATILQARDNLALGTNEQRAYALEIFEVTLPEALRYPVLSLITDLPVEEQFRRLSTRFPQERLNCEARLADLSDLSNGRLTAWSRACARYAQRALSFTTNGDHAMDPIIERVITLKATGVFSGIPDRVLAEVAGLCEEMQVDAGATIFQKGEIGKSLYVIAAGRVRVHDEDQTLEYLEQGQVFGEMALFDPEPRSASITAVEETQLLRLDQEPFFELVADQSEVARGIIKMLTRRLRARMHDLNELRSQVGGEAGR
jgi:AAA family ATP:ADP antiporter